MRVLHFKGYFVKFWKQYLFCKNHPCLVPLIEFILLAKSFLFYELFLRVHLCTFSYTMTTNLSQNSILTSSNLFRLPTILR